MILRVFVLLNIIMMSILLTACNDEGELDEGFDPTPYLAEAFQRLATYEQVSINPETAKWIYADQEDSELSVLYLFVSFGRSGESSTFYAMLTVYINKVLEAEENTFIDRIYLDELGADQSSLTGFNIMYDNMLNQVNENELFTVELGDISSETIAAAMA